MIIEDVIVDPVTGKMVPAPPPPPLPFVNTVHTPADTSTVWCNQCQNDTGVPQCQASRTRIKRDSENGWFRNTPCNVFQPKRAAPPPPPAGTTYDSESLQLVVTQQKDKYVIQVPATMWMFFDSALRKGAQAMGAQIKYTQEVDWRTRGRNREAKTETKVAPERPRKRGRPYGRVSGVSEGVPRRRVRRATVVPEVPEKTAPDGPAVLTHQFGDPQ
jgi:hypothetical protein